MQCPQCRAAVGDDSRFCDECGAPLPKPCPSCGGTNRPGAKFCSTCGAKLNAAAAAVPREEIKPSPEAPAATSSAERRQLTVMFCDLVNSTALSARLDAEDFRELLGRYHRRVAKIVERFGGYVAKYMGDGVLAYFGYPRAREDDAERAIRAGLKLAYKVGGLADDAGTPLAVRVSIATGMVIVGDLLGEGEAQERGVVGETPNLAARLQTIAPPGAVIVAAASRRLVGRLFEYEDLGTVDLKGFPEPVQAWRVLRASAVESRFEALRSSAEAPLVGRDEELELMLRRWARAKQGQGQVLLLSGEAGIGKSRLLAALEEHVKAEPHIHLRYFCSPQRQDSALAPFVAQIEHALGGDTVSDREEKRRRLEALFAQGGGTADDVAAVAELLGLPGAVLPYAAQRKKELVLDAMTRQIVGLSAHRPVLAVFEDAHWADASSLEMLELGFSRTLGEAAVLTVVTFRPEFRPPWMGRPNVTLMSLSRLDHRQGAAIARHIAGSRIIPDDVLQEIISRTDGVPLFVEEFTKSVLESGYLREVGRSASDPRLPSFAIPATLHDALMARLDRLSAVKEVAQVGAVIGRSFSWRLVSAVSGLTDENLAKALNQLVAGELLIQRSEAPHAVYTFKHALLQDTVYGSLLRERRQHLHERITEVLEADFPEEAPPEVLAHHATEARLFGKAIRLWRSAGETATRRSATHEAINQYRRALSLLAQQPHNAERDTQELELLIALGPVLMSALPTGSPEIVQLYARARELAGSQNRTEDLFAILWGSWIVANVGGQGAAARQIIAQLHMLADQLGDSGSRVQALHCEFTSAYQGGELQKAVALGAQMIQRYDQVEHRHHALRFGGHDPGVCALSVSGLCLAAMGRSNEARTRGQEALQLSEQLDHPSSVVHALRFLGDIQVVLQDFAGAQQTAERILAMPADQVTAVARANARMLRGWALVAGRNDTEGVGDLRDGLAAWRATGSTYDGAYRLTRAADAHLRVNDLTTAELLLEEAYRLETPLDERWFAPELRRLSGLLSLARGEAAAERLFEEAIALARSTGALRFELRAASSLASLCMARGRHGAVASLLSPLLTHFTVDDGLDIREARKAVRSGG